MFVVIHCLLTVWINAPPLLTESTTEPRPATANDRGFYETPDNAPPKDPRPDGGRQGHRWAHLGL